MPSCERRGGEEEEGEGEGSSWIRSDPFFQGWRGGGVYESLIYMQQ